MKRHNDQGNSYKRQQFNWGWLAGSDVQQLSSWQEAWQHPGRHGGGDGAESSGILIRSQPGED